MNAPARKPTLPVVWRQRPFVGDLKCRVLDVGVHIPTIAEIIAGIPENELPRGFAELGEVRINGEVIPRGLWHLVRPKYRPDHETVVTLHIPLGGPSGGSSGGSSSGKSSLALVASIAVLLVAAAVSGGALGLVGISLGAAAPFVGLAIGCGGPLEAERKMGTLMTAITIIKQSKAVHVLTDGAAFNADGTLLSAMVKAWPIPHLNAVVAARGSAHFAPFFALFASCFAKSFDDFKIVTTSIAREVLSEHSALLERSWQGSQFELVVAGWSESANAPACYFLCNHTLHAETAPPWQLVEIGPIGLLPQTEAMEADLAREYPNGLREDDADPVGDGLRILEIQRRHPFQPNPDGQSMYVGAGAFVQLTTVTKDGISTKIIRRWPDEIGKPLWQQAGKGSTR